MALYVPPGVTAEGSVSVLWVPVIADPAAPKPTELTATGALNISCYLTKDGFGVTSEQETSTDERFCSKQVFETLGKIKETFDDLVYVYDSQNPASLTHKAYVTLAPGSKGYLVIRWCKDNETAIAVGDVVDVYPVAMGTQTKRKPEANSNLHVQQKIVQIGFANKDVALVA